MRWSGLLMLLCLAALAAGCGLPAQPPAGIAPPAPASPTPFPPPTKSADRSPTLTRPSPTADRPSPAPTGPAAVRAATAVINEVIQSPDRDWRIELRLYDCNPADGFEAIARLVLVHIPDGGEQVVENQPQFCGFMGDFGLEPLFWAPSSRYFYYTTTRETIPTGYCGFFWDRPLKRLEIASGATQIMGIGAQSPDGSKLVTWLGTQLAVWDIDQGQIAALTALHPSGNPGPIAWSPDSRSFVYLQTTPYCYNKAENSYLVRVDLSSLAQLPLLETSSTFLRVAWDTPGIIRLFDEQEQAWVYNIHTGLVGALP